VVLNHVGLTAPDIFAAVDRYTDIFGLRLIM
jgi:catechol 2,3-dioxygenase-like lactoylglutathione lyase family enzyme